MCVYARVQVSIHEHEEYFNITFEHAHALMGEVLDKQDDGALNRDRRGAQICTLVARGAVFCDVS